MLASSSNRGLDKDREGVAILLQRLVRSKVLDIDACLLETQTLVGLCQY